MANTGNKIYNLYINPANRLSNDKAFDFTIFFDNDDIVVNANEEMNVNSVSFSMLNSIYNVNKHTGNNKVSLKNNYESTLLASLK